MKRILFVDDDARELERYRELFADLVPEWELGFAPNGKEAIRQMFQAPYDVVVTDYSMPEMDGSELLDLVMQRYPRAVRVMVCTPEERATGIKLVGRAHQDLAKPAEREALVAAIERAMALRELLANNKLKALVSQVLSLPSMPDLYLRLLDELNAEEPSIERVGDVIQRDPAMCAKLLQLVNSAFFGLPQKIGNPGEAAMYVGVDTIKALVLSLQFFALFERVRIPEFSFEALWAHSWNTGLIAKRLARLERLDYQQTDLAFTAGLLHDAGKLVLASGLPNQYQAVLRLQQQRPVPVWELEREVLGAGHAEVGAYLLALWALPDPLVEALAWHHRPSESLQQVLGPLAIVHAADVLEQERRAARGCLAALDQEYLRAVGAWDRLEDWREAAQSVLRGEDEV
jgi:HD-like signal output (HDOD) protein